MTRPILVTFLAVTLAGADFSGAWSGTMDADSPQGERMKMGAHFVFKQTGGSIEGTAGPSADKQFTIRKGRIEGDRIIVEASPNGRNILRFELQLKDQQLAGDVFEDGARIGTATLKREK